MKILIAADMEGITGVVDWNQTDPSHAEYSRCREQMTTDVNSAIEGVFEAGANEVIVTDGHANGRNILLSQLDPRAHLVSGGTGTYGMVEGVQNGVDGVLFIGYHARAGTPYAILDHTFSGRTVWNMSLNGRPIGEIGLNAALCGHSGAPVLMVSGCQAACREAIEFLGEVETAAVKRAAGRLTAELLPPAQTCGMICEAAAQGIFRLRQSRNPHPYLVKGLLTLSVDFASSEHADRAALLPGAERAGRTISYSTEDIVTLHHALYSLLALAKT